MRRLARALSSTKTPAYALLRLAAAMRILPSSGSLSIKLSYKSKYAGAPAFTVAGSSLFTMAFDKFVAIFPVVEEMILEQPLRAKESRSNIDVVLKVCIMVF